MNVKFYTTHCPKCRVLKTKLDAKGIQYEEVEDIDEMLSLGLKSAPALVVGDELKTFSEALSWVKTLED